MNNDKDQETIHPLFITELSNFQSKELLKYIERLQRHIELEYISFDDIPVHLLPNRTARRAIEKLQNNES